MQTLLLTSAGMTVSEEILKILTKSPEQTKVAYIVTASNVEEDKTYVERDRRELVKLGFQVEEIDIAGKTIDELRNLLRDKDVIYVQGGNTFYLLKCVRESGFDVVVKELLAQGVIYIGVSAGSYIACPTIEMAAWPPQDRNQVGLTDLRAMSLVPFLLTVHYEPQYKEMVKAEVALAKYPVRILTDNQALLVFGDQVVLLGKEAEVSLD